MEDHEKETIEQKDYPGKIDLTLEIEANATVGHPDIMLDTFALKVGKHTDCVVGNTKISAYVVRIDCEEIMAQKGLTKEAESK